MKKIICGLAVGSLSLSVLACQDPDQLVNPPLRNALAARAASTAAATSTFETVIDGSSFGSYSALESTWNYLYPWGGDHNGSARMYGSSTDHDNVILSGGVLTLKAVKISWNEGNSMAPFNVPIRYHSGAIHAKHQVLINDQFPDYEVKGTFQAPSVTGTWPAFWLTGVNTWPPESDILEFKGTNENWFNTFRTDTDVPSQRVAVSSPGDWHTYRAWITKVNATEVDIHYYLDGNWKAVHRAAFVGKPMYIILNLQMEGSSGSPGPTTDTYYRAKDLYVGRTRAY